VSKQYDRVCRPTTPDGAVSYLNQA